MTNAKKMAVSTNHSPSAIRERLEHLADETYRTFAASLLPGCGPLLGVRLPMLRKIAQEIAKGDFRAFAGHAPTGCFEEVMLLGMVIGYAKAGPEEKLACVKRFVPLISNWSVCDSFCTGLTFTKQNRDMVFEYLLSCLSSGYEFTVRFAVVMLLTYYIDDLWIDRVFHLLDGVRHDGYYARMAVAWAVSICYVKYPEKTKAYLDRCRLDDVTFNKALQKITESLRVDPETKRIIRAMRRK